MPPPKNRPAPQSKNPGIKTALAFPARRYLRPELKDSEQFVDQRNRATQLTMSEWPMPETFSTGISGLAENGRSSATVAK